MCVLNAYSALGLAIYRRGKEPQSSSRAAVLHERTPQPVLQVLREMLPPPGACPDAQAQLGSPSGTPAAFLVHLQAATLHTVL